MGNKVRHNGATTRLVDLYIQELFNGDEVEFKDHNLKGHAQFIVHKIVDRLNAEHQIQTMSRAKVYDPEPLKGLEDAALVLIVHHHQGGYMVGEFTTKKRMKFKTE